MPRLPKYTPQQPPRTLQLTPKRQAMRKAKYKYLEVMRRKNVLRSNMEIYKALVSSARTVVHGRLPRSTWSDYVKNIINKTPEDLVWGTGQSNFYIFADCLDISDDIEWPKSIAPSIASWQQKMSQALEKWKAASKRYNDITLRMFYLPLLKQRDGLKEWILEYAYVSSKIISAVDAVFDLVEKFGLYIDFALKHES